MSIKKILLWVLLLTFLSGTFTTERLDIGIIINIRYLLLLSFLFFFFIWKKNTGINQRMIINSRIMIFLSLFISYLFFSAISMFYSANLQQPFEKLNLLFFLLILIICILIVLGEMKAEEFYSIISTFFITVGFIYSLPVFLSVLSGANRGDVNLSGPNVTTRILFFATCSSFYMFILRRKISYIILGIIFIASIILVGSRGGLIGAIITLSILFLVNNVFKLNSFKLSFNFSYKKMLIFPIILGIIIFIYEPVKRVFTNRIIGVTFNDGGIYTSGRDVIYSEALRMIKEKPLFGYGIDSFTVHTGQVYPHNLLLEMMVEIGLIGAVIFIGFTVFAIWFILKMKRTTVFIFTGLPLYMIIVQMLSGEFYDFRYYFLWSIPLLYYGFNKETILKNNDSFINKNS